ncbi:MAG: hypothetical protein A2189_05275 [Paenibacillus sp. RIFOXYA1_FULL_44_5]|nr:MAG: hypothetical protein A2189_05275 [Paenibacillus sp. RIFOXYA1_FULL_44_5]
MKRKRLTRLAAITVVSTVLLVTACGVSNQAQTTPTPTNPSPKTQTVDPLAKYDPPITITEGRLIDPNNTAKDGETYDNNVWNKLFTDNGINIQYQWTSTDQNSYDNKVNISIASGGIPDIFPVNGMQLKMLADNNQLADLTEIYQKYASPLTKKIMGDDGGLAFKSATFGGKLLAIPQTHPTIGENFLWVRTDWLKKLNLPAPQTMQDVLKIAKAFATEDPNGSGKHNTIGLGAAKGLWGGWPGLEGFFNGYHAYPNIWIKDATGKLVYGSVQPEMKAALTQLQQLYKDGIIDKEFGVKDGGKVAESIASGQLGMFYGAWWAPAYPLQAGKNQDPKMQWQAYPILSADNQPASAQNPFYVSNYYVAKKGSKHPEALIKLLNLWFEKMYGGSANDYLTYGIKKDSTQVYKFANIFGWPPNYLSNDRSDHIMAALNSKDPSKLTVEEKSYYDEILAFRNGDNKQWSVEGMYGSFSVWPAWHHLVDNKLIMQNAFYGAPTPTMADKGASLNTLQNEEITKIIMGEVPVSDFDNFVASWKKLGGDQETKEVNDWYALQK